MADRTGSNPPDINRFGSHTENTYHSCISGIPVWVGRRIKSRHTFSSKPRRVTAIAAGVVSSVGPETDR